MSGPKKNSKTASSLGKWRVYSDPEVYEETQEMFKGVPVKSVLDAGFVYAPYIPLQVTPTVKFGKDVPNSPLEDFVEGVFKEEIESGDLKPLRKKTSRSGMIDPSDFTLRKGLRTRYAKKLVDPDFFGTVDVTNL